MTQPIKIDIQELNRRMDEAMDERSLGYTKLLSEIKSHRETLASIHRSIVGIEPELVYRYYHQSFKVFMFKEIIQFTKKTFEDLSPDAKPLNDWFLAVVDYALEAEFNNETTNKNWLLETRPILEALWHCKFFVEQMLSSADSLEEAPKMLPYDWAAVLYLYNIR